MVTMTEVRGSTTTGRMYLKASDLSPGMSRVGVYRYVDREMPVALRAIYRRSSTGGFEPSAVVIPPYDYECPLNTKVGYAAVEWPANGTMPAAPAQPQMYGIIDCPPTDAWLTDVGHPIKNIRVQCLTDFGEVKYGANVGIFRPIGRPRAVAVSTARNWWEGTLTWITQTALEAELCIDMFADGGMVMLRTGSAYDKITEYVQPMDLTVQKMSLQTLPQRRMSCEIIAVDAPVGSRLLEDGVHYNELGYFKTYAELLTSFHNYYDLLRFEVIS